MHFVNMYPQLPAFPRLVLVPPFIGFLLYASLAEYPTLGQFLEPPPVIQSVSLQEALMIGRLVIPKPAVDVPPLKLGEVCFCETSDRVVGARGDIMQPQGYDPDDPDQKSISLPPSTKPKDPEKKSKNTAGTQVAVSSRSRLPTEDDELSGPGRDPSDTAALTLATSQKSEHFDQSAMRLASDEGNIQSGRTEKDDCICLSRGPVYPSLPELLISINVGSSCDFGPATGEEVGTWSVPFGKEGGANFIDLPYEISHEWAFFLDSYRYGKRFGYQFYLADGDLPHTLRLAWSEKYEPDCERGSKRLDVAINGKIHPRLKNLDVLVAAGGCGRALVVEVGVRANKDGVLTVEFLASEKVNTTTAFINVIQIFRHNEIVPETE